MKHTKKTQSFAAITAALALLAATPGDATAAYEPFVGEISYVGLISRQSVGINVMGNYYPIANIRHFSRYWAPPMAETE